jgi:hypothetical protein
MKKDFGILVFGFSRPLYIADVLTSLEKQGALEYVDVWIDGHQGNPDVKLKVDLVKEVVSKFAVNKIYNHNGNLGFRKLLLQALSEATAKYKHIMILEDDCFPTRHAVEVFKLELKIIENEPDVFSIYGHPFLVEAEGETCPRFQGWGWGTTSEKLKPFLKQLIDCYSLTEERYLSFVEEVLTDEVKSRIDVTPLRQPSETLTKFFAWDETLGLLTALAGKVHKKTSVRTIYNCGACQDSSRFKYVEWYLKPPFNMVHHNKIWDYF